MQTTASSTAPQDLKDWCPEAGVSLPHISKFKDTEYFPHHFKIGRRIRITERAIDWRERTGGLPSLKPHQARYEGPAK